MSKGSDPAAPPSIVTRLAHAGWADHRLRGRALFGELLGSFGHWQLLSLAVGGPDLSPAQVTLLEDIALCTNLADPRVPPMKVVRLLSSYGGIMAALGGGYVAHQHALFGSWGAGLASAWLWGLAQELGSHRDRTGLVEEVLRGRLESGERPVGFGVPARREDERCEAMRRVVRTRGFDHGPYWQLAETCERVLEREREISLNGAGAFGAACLDLGFDPDQVGMLGVAAGLPGFAGNAMEGAHQAPPELRELPPRCVDYLGPPPRPSPRARRHAGRGASVAHAHP